MEPQFKTSFIPKKPIAPVSSRRMRSVPLGILFAGASIVLIAALLVAGAAFGYGKYLEQDIAKKSAALELARSDLQPGLIAELQRLDARMEQVSGLLNNHLALSPVFTLLEDSTTLSVQYTKFGYLIDPDGGVMLALSGKTSGFERLAVQSDVLQRNPTFTDVTFTNLAVDEFGAVTFDLALTVDVALVAYQNLVAESAEIMEGLPAEGAATSTASESDAGESIPNPSVQP